MAYNQPPYQGGGYPPQQPPGWQQPPAPYPPQQGYPPPQQHSPYPPAQGQYPPPAQGYQQPVAPPQGYPPQGYPPPAAAPYAAPPAHQAYGSPPPQQPFGQPPPGQYGAPPPAQYYAPPTAPATLGYDPTVIPQTDMNRFADDLRAAMAGMGTDEKKLINILASVPDAPHMIKLRHTYDQKFRRRLIDDLEKETSGWFEYALCALARGPLLEDARLVDRAIRGAGTKESVLNDVVLGRSNADLNAIKMCYKEIYHKDMVKEIREDLSMKTAKLFEYVLEARRSEDSVPIIPDEVEANVTRLHDATEAVKVGTQPDIVSHLLAHSSDNMIRAMNQAYKARYRIDLDTLFSRNFTGHMKDAFRLMAARAVDPVKAVADQLEESMKGIGTKDEQLINTLIRAHWDRNIFRQVKIAYKQFYGVELINRIQGETSGDYRRFLIAICQQ